MDSSNNNSDEINLNSLFQSFYTAKFFIVLISLLFSISGIFYALSLPDIFKSDATLMDPVSIQSTSSSLGNISNRYSGIASMAGIELPGQSATQKDVSLAMLRSRDFFRNYYDDKVLLKDLISYQEFDQLNYVDLYLPNGESIIEPNFINSFILFNSHFSVNHNVKNNIIKMSFQHQSPIIAKKWLDKIILDINQYVKNQEVTKASAIYEVLTNKLGEVKNPDLSFVVSKLAEKQIQTITLANVTDEFAFTIIDSASMPEKKSKPFRTWIVLLFTAVGLFISFFLVLISYYLQFSIFLTIKIPFINFTKRLPANL